MWHLSRAALAATLVFQLRPALAGTVTIDLPAAIDRAHHVSPIAAQARGQIGEAEGVVVGADMLFTTNPEIEAGAGPRFVTPRLYDIDARIAQDLEPGRRGPRRALARAELLHAGATADTSFRELDLEVAFAFYETIHADRILDLDRGAEDLAQRAADFADRRRKAGDATDLEANLARAALGRARSATQAATSERAAAVARLAAVIGADPSDTLIVKGDLRVAVTDLQALRNAIVKRADVRALDAERSVAAAEHDVATANARPDLGLWLGYRREGGDDIVLGGIRATLPTWNRAQGDKAIASARARRATEMRTATLLAATRELGDALEAYTHANDAVAVYEHDVLPALDDSEKLLSKSVDAGQLAVNEYLVARQEVLSGRREYLDRLLGLAKAAATVRYIAGVSQ
ncbi:MAG: outer rane efflux protein [Myxococcales bacterium]|nr:outer rane efflux protein [Myxococcales bacterium]